MTRSCMAFALLASLVLLGQTASAQRGTGYDPKGGPDIGAESVSLVKLIATPERYDNKKVRIIGYLHLEFEGSAVYLHQDDFIHGISDNGIWINLPKDIQKDQIKTVNDHYVICTARFVAGRHGHMGMFAGELDGVTRLEIWPTWGEMDIKCTRLPSQRSSMHRPKALLLGRGAIRSPI